jgi:hypothetical protein
MHARALHMYMYFIFVAILPIQYLHGGRMKYAKYVF